MLDDLITHGCANANRVCFCHNPAGVNGETDKECIHHKKTRFTIARVLVQSKCEFWIKETALHAWINAFLPKHSQNLFPEEAIQKLLAGFVAVDVSAFSHFPIHPPSIPSGQLDIFLWSLPPLITDPIRLQKSSSFGFYLSFCIHISQVNFKGVP